MTAHNPPLTLQDAERKSRLLQEKKKIKNKAERKRLKKQVKIFLLSKARGCLLVKTKVRRVCRRQTETEGEKTGFKNGKR